VRWCMTESPAWCRRIHGGDQARSSSRMSSRRWSPISLGR
jgi:hypothetical protein